VNRTSVLLIALATCLIPGFLGAEPISDVQAKAELDRILTQNIIPFWFPKCIDREMGGFRLNHDTNGQWLGPGPKALVTQSRTVWFFARLANSPYGRPEHLEAALHGYRFLADKMWDPEYGGFFWMVDASGEKPEMEKKHVYGQSFALYALSELYRAQPRADILELARKTFQALEVHAHDSAFGGYRESFERDWTPIEDSERSYLGTPNRVKSMNSHLHLMEALSSYYRVTRDVLARERLLELISIETSAVVRKRVGACSDQHERDWTPLTGPAREVASYGHDLENVWLLMEACDSAAIADGPFVDLYRTLFEYSIEYGLDPEQGGFFYTGPFNRAAQNREKSWWVQAEVLVGSLRMFRRTGDEKYKTLFGDMLNWISNHQVDWQNGEWFATVETDGSTSGLKAGPWKSPYHNGRAVLECLRLLSTP